MAEAIEWTESYLSRMGAVIPPPNRLQKLLEGARKGDEVREPFHDCELRLGATEGAWGNLLAPNALNLIVAAPKVGKSALITHVFACSKRGDAECLGRPMRARWNKLIISGNDMAAAEWGKILIREGLGVATSATTFRPSPDVFIWDVSNPAKLDERGIAAMRAKCLEHPGSLLVIDSLRSNTDHRLDENKSEIRGPIEALKQAMEGCDATIVLIHHANKTGASTGINAAAGSNAIGGSVDSTLYLRHLKGDVPGMLRQDNRIVASSSGRLESDSLLMELVKDNASGHWEARGGPEEALLEEHIAEVEERLTSRQGQAWSHARTLEENGVHLTSNELASHLNITSRDARDTIKQLCRKGLLVKCGTLETGRRGQPAGLYAPALSELAQASYTSPHVPRMGSYPPYSDKGGVKGIRGIENDLSRESSQLAHVEPLRGTPLVAIPQRTRVERKLPDGTWENSWIVRDGTNPHNITIEKLGYPDYRKRGLCWEEDLRPCQPKPATDQDIEPLPF